MTSKTLAPTDARGNLTGFRLLRGTAAPVEGPSGGRFLADRAFDVDWLRGALICAGTGAIYGNKQHFCSDTLPRDCSDKPRVIESASWQTRRPKALQTDQSGKAGLAFLRLLGESGIHHH